MELRLTPKLEAELEAIAAESGTPIDELVENVMSGYVKEIAERHSILDSRYDDVKSGKVKLIPGEEVEAYFREKMAAAGFQQPDS